MNPWDGLNWVTEVERLPQPYRTVGKVVNDVMAGVDDAIYELENKRAEAIFESGLEGMRPSNEIPGEGSLKLSCRITAVANINSGITGMSGGSTKRNLEKFVPSNAGAFDMDTARPTQEVPTSSVGSVKFSNYEHWVVAGGDGGEIILLDPIGNRIIDSTTLGEEPQGEKGEKQDESDTIQKKDPVEHISLTVGAYKRRVASENGGNAPMWIATSPKIVAAPRYGNRIEVWDLVSRKDDNINYSNVVTKIPLKLRRVARISVSAPPEPDRYEQDKSEVDEDGHDQDNKIHVSDKEPEDSRKSCILSCQAICASGALWVSTLLWNWRCQIYKLSLGVPRNKDVITNKAVGETETGDLANEDASTHTGSAVLEFDTPFYTLRVPTFQLLSRNGSIDLIQRMQIRMQFWVCHNEDKYPLYGRPGNLVLWSSSSNILYYTSVNLCQDSGNTRRERDMTLEDLRKLPLVDLENQVGLAIKESKTLRISKTWCCPAEVTAFAHSASGTSICIGTDTGYTALFDTMCLDYRFNCGGHYAAVKSITYSGNTKVISCGADGWINCIAVEGGCILHRWNTSPGLHAGVKVQSLLGGHNPVSMSLDERKNMRLFDLQYGKKMCKLEWGKELVPGQTAVHETGRPISDREIQIACGTTAFSIFTPSCSSAGIAGSGNDSSTEVLRSRGHSTDVLIFNLHDLVLEMFPGIRARCTTECAKKNVPSTQAQPPVVVDPLKLFKWLTPEARDQPVVSTGLGIANHLSGVRQNQLPGVGSVKSATKSSASRSNKQGQRRRARGKTEDPERAAGKDKLTQANLEQHLEQQGLPSIVEAQTQTENELSFAQTEKSADGPGITQGQSGNVVRPGAGSQQEQNRANVLDEYSSCNRDLWRKNVRARFRQALSVRNNDEGVKTGVRKLAAIRARLGAGGRVDE